MSENSYSNFSDIHVPTLQIPDGSFSSGYVTQGWTEDKSHLSVTTYAETKPGTSQNKDDDGKTIQNPSQCCLII